MNIKLLLLGVCTLVAVSNADPLSFNLSPDTEKFFKDEWAKFKEHHGRTYSTLFEAAKRFKIFVDNIRSILSHNLKFKNGEATFKQDMNVFGDQTASEVNRKRNGFDLAQQIELFGNASETADVHRRSRRSATQLPAEVNWVTKGAVAPVLDQGDCGSCWAFSSLAALEALHFRQTGQLPQLSVQQLVDCSTANHGCDGGSQRLALAYVQNNGGVTTFSSYPYTARQNACQQRGSPAAAVNRIATVPYNDEQRLKEVVATVGPVAVAIDASQRSFQFYSGGIYFDNKCQPGAVNHGVLVVGYGTDKATGMDYWLVKNSWGQQWGEKGYIRMARNFNSNCCIACYGILPNA